MRVRTPRLLYASGMALTGSLASALGAGTEWSYYNALIPGVYFVALAVGTAAAVLETRRPVLAPLLLAAAIATAPGGLAALVMRALPRTASGLAVPLGYDLRPYLPTPDDRTRGDALLARLAAVPGDVFVPDHSFYPHLAGKTTRVHELDAQGRIVLPSTLRDFAGLKVDAVVVGALDHIELWEPNRWASTSEEMSSDVFAERIAGPRVHSGGRFEPCCVLVPREGPSDPLR